MKTKTDDEIWAFQVARQFPCYTEETIGDLLRALDNDREAALRICEAGSRVGLSISDFLSAIRKLRTRRLLQYLNDET